MREKVVPNKEADREKENEEIRNEVEKTMERVNKVDVGRHLKSLALYGKTAEVARYLV